MHPASAAVVLLAPYLAKAGEVAASTVGERAVDMVGDLYQAIRRKFTADNDPYAQMTLQRLEEQPADQGR